MLSGYAEKEHISDFAFETQRKTYHSYGYAQDPSKPIDEEDDTLEDKQVVSRVGIDEKAQGINIWQSGHLRKRRKKDRADDPSDIEGWKGPWARFKDEKSNEELAAKGEIREEMDAILEKRRAKKAARRTGRGDEEEVIILYSRHHVLIKYIGRCDERDDNIAYQRSERLFREKLPSSSSRRSG